ncbi:MAG TPA: (5-formylfuran-3-yl)methyl phosphate synthase [Dongiaceae bacterium]
MTGFLASVTSAMEAEVALAGGADIIDLKDPSQGALGALPPATIREAVAAIAKRRIVSATAGDLKMEPGLVAAAVRELAATGVDIVKVGLFPGGDLRACLEVLGLQAKQGTRLVAVIFADQAPDFALIGQIRANGFAGIMLDTAGKSTGGLRNHLSQTELANFVRTASAAGLMTGLAGSLSVEDVDLLVRLGPDYLGFRGGICVHGRQSALSPERLRAVRAAIDGASAYQRAARTAVAAAGAQRAAHSTA